MQVYLQTRRTAIICIWRSATAKWSDSGIELAYRNTTSGQNVQKWKGTKMSRKNGKNLLIVIAVGAVVVKAVRDVIKAKKQEEELRSALDDFYSLFSIFLFSSTIRFTSPR